MSGLSADARTLVDHARSESQYHRFTFNEPMPVESLTQSVCDLALRFGEAGEEGAMSAAQKALDVRCPARSLAAGCAFRGSSMQFPAL